LERSREDGRGWFRTELLLRERVVGRRPEQLQGGQALLGNSR
jgi:hypothetical protein